MTAAAGLSQQRPTVLGTDPRRFWSLTWTLAATDFKLRFYGSVLGYVWTLARPFMFFGVIYLVFSQIVGLDENVENYGVYILFALVLFQFFNEATSNCVGCLVARESLLRKMHFPRLVIPLSVILTAVFNLAATLVAVFVFAVATGVYPSWGWLELPVIVAAVGVFATGVGLVLASLFVQYRDVQPIWDVVSQMLFYASPILYVTTLVPEAYREAYLLNPLAVLLTEMRVAVVDPGAPHAWDIAGAGVLAVPAAIVLVAVAAGLYVFNWRAPKIAEDL